MLYRRTARDEPDRTADLYPLTLARTRAGKFKRVAEYVDVATGEVVPGDSMPPALQIGDKVEARAAILKSLRPEAREFAEFVIGFANKRRGITPAIGELCHWYAELTGKRPDNVRRLIKPLMAAKVLANDNLLGLVFQRTGGTLRDHLSEAENASARYTLLRSTGRPLESLASAGNRRCPADLVAAEVAKADAEMLDERADWFAAGFPDLSRKLTWTPREPA